MDISRYKHCIGILFIFLVTVSVKAQNGVVKQIANPESELAARILYDSDGGIFIGGITRVSEDAENDIFVAHHSESGDRVWIDFYGQENREEYLVDMVLAPDGHVLLLIDQRVSGGFGGLRSANILLIKIDRSGNVIWQTLIDYGLKDIPLALVVTPSGPSVALCATTSFSTGTFEDKYLWIEIDADGDVIQDTIIANFLGDVEEFWVDGEGRFYAISANDRLSLLSPRGELKWTKKIGTDFSSLNLSDIVGKKDGSLLVAGSGFNEENMEYAPFIAQLSAEGDLIWQQFYDNNGGIGVINEILICEESNHLIGVGLNSDSETLFVGYYFLQTDLEGREISSHTYALGEGFDISSSVEALSVTAIPGAKVMAAGYNNVGDSTNTLFNTMLLTETINDFECSPDQLTANGESPHARSSGAVFPTLVTEGFVVKVEDRAISDPLFFILQDDLGRVVLRERLSTTEHYFNNTNLHSGIYYYRVHSQGEVLHKGRLVFVGN